jgi:hypothetical protein
MDTVTEARNLKKIQSLLVGRTILKIEPPDDDEQIFKFVLVDGSSFKLYATELGWWIDEIKK